MLWQLATGDRAQRALRSTGDRQGLQTLFEKVRAQTIESWRRMVTGAHPPHSSPANE